MSEGGATQQASGARLALPPPADPPQGAAYILLTRQDGKSFRYSNPFAIARNLKAVWPQQNTAKVIQSGKILISTEQIDQSRAWLAVTSFIGKPVEAQLAHRMMSVQGLIHAPELCEMTDQEILDELASQGVCEVQRLRSSTEQPNPLIRLRFVGLQLPARLTCGYLSVRVKAWVDVPRQCRKCWRHGHPERSCRSRVTICGRCSAEDQHATSECQQPFKCARCHGPHTTWDRRACPVWAAVKKEAHKRTPRTQPQPRPTQSPPPSGITDGEWPDLPPLSPVPSTPLVASPTARPSAALRDSGTQTELEQPAPSVAQSASQTEPEQSASATTQSASQTEPVLTETIQSATQTEPEQLVHAATTQSATQTDTSPSTSDADTQSDIPPTTEEAPSPMSLISVISDADSSDTSSHTIVSTPRTPTPRSVPQRGDSPIFRPRSWQPTSFHSRPRVVRYCLVNDQGRRFTANYVLKNDTTVENPSRWFLRPGSEQWVAVTNAAYTDFRGRPLTLVEDTEEVIEPAQ